MGDNRRGDRRNAFRKAFLLRNGSIADLSVRGDEKAPLEHRDYLSGDLDEKKQVRKTPKLHEKLSAKPLAHRLGSKKSKKTL